MRNIVSSSSFDISFVADQSAARAALDAIANADQFFIIRYLNVENSASEGPPRGGDAEAAAAAAAPQPDSSQQQQPGAAPAAPAALAQPGVTVLAGRETLTVSLRIEMITFNNLPDTK
jgi:hypothetical protein